jgi:AcrR family transcriptional regulator
MNTATCVSSRDRILFAAKTLFARNGYENTSTVAIARQAGTSESQLMKHFGSKQGLLSAIFDLGWSNILQRVRGLASDTHRSPRVLVDLMEGLIVELDRDPEIKTLLMLEARRVRKDSPDLSLSQGFVQFSSFLEEILTDLKNHGVLTPEVNVKAARAALFGMVEGMVFDQLASTRSGGFGLYAADDSRRILEAMVCGLSAHQVPSGR